MGVLGFVILLEDIPRGLGYHDLRPLADLHAFALRAADAMTRPDTESAQGGPAAHSAVAFISNAFGQKPITGAIILVVVGIDPYSKKRAR